LSADITVRLVPVRGADPMESDSLLTGRERVSAREDLAADAAADARRFRDDAELERAD